MPDRIRPTVWTVSREAQVSAQTVSRVLTGSANVKPEKAERVLAAIKSQGYTPDAVGRSLRATRTPMIGLVVADVTNPFYARLHRALEKSVGPIYSLMLLNCDDHPGVERRQLDLLRSYRPTGLVIAPSAGSSLDESDVALFENVVTVSRQIESFDVPAVVTDEAFAMTAATNELIAYGHRRIAAVLGREGISTTSQREQGFVDTIAGHPDIVGMVRYTGGSSADGRAAMRELFESATAPTAVIGFNSQVSEGMLAAMWDARLECPRDISIIAFTDVGWMESHRPPITAVAQPVEEMGRLAGSFIQALARGESVANGPHIVPSRLIRRESVAAPAEQRNLS